MTDRMTRTLMSLALAAGLAACDTSYDATAPVESDAQAFSFQEPASFSIERVPEGTFHIPCLADSGEPDDDAASAMAASWDSPVTRSACEGNVDFFTMDFEEGQPAEVVARFNRAEGDLELVISDPDGHIVASSEIRGDRAVAELVAGAAGTYRIVAVLTGDRGGQGGTTYTLRVKDPLAVCNSDPYDSADVDVPLDSVDGVLADLAACEGDEDWFTFEATQGQALSVAIDSWSDLGDVDFALYDPAGEYAGGAFGEADYEQFETEANATGEYRVLVFLADGAQAGVPYDIEVQVRD